MGDFWQKVLWIALPACAGLGVTLIPGPAVEVQVIAYAVLAFVAASGIWATNARKHRIERESAEQARWDALNARLDEIDERLGRSEGADRAMLRSDLVRAHREWVEEKGYITLEALEVVAKTHEAYNDVNGNDTGDRLWEDIRSLPIEEHRRK